MEERRENIMGTQPINRLLPSMAFPIMLSMLVQALYNVVDSVFVSMVSENALTSVSLAFPVQNLMIAVSVGTAVGINALDVYKRQGHNIALLQPWQFPRQRVVENHVLQNGIGITQRRRAWGGCRRIAAGTQCRPCLAYQLQHAGGNDLLLEHIVRLSLIHI